MVAYGSWRQYRRSRVADFRFSGSVLEWKGRFGWIAPDTSIDHPEASKHQWRVYVNVSDLDGGVTLCGGSRVTFFAYTDGDGVGAEDVRLEDDDADCTDTASPPSTQARYRRPGHWRVQPTIEKHGAGQPAGVGGRGKAKGRGGSVAAVARAPAVPAAPTSSPPTPPAALLAPGGLGGPDRRKTTRSGKAGNLSWASAEMRGWRPAMEDAMAVLLDLAAPLEAHALFGVFDGHGGAEVSRRVSEALPDEVVACAAELVGEATDAFGATDAGTGLAARALDLALPRLDEQLRAAGAGLNSSQFGAATEPNSGGPNAFDLMGSTAVVALLECDGPPALGSPERVTVANLGDSRALLCRGGEAVALTEDQKPDVPEERARIEAAGGFVAPVGPCQRIDGWGLNLSRALGDFHYKARADLPQAEQKVSTVPEVRACELQEDDEFLLLCCDGVFELKSSQQAVDQVREGLLAGRPPTKVLEELLDACCSPDLFQTRGQGSDNVSALLVLLR